MDTEARLSPLPHFVDDAAHPLRGRLGLNLPREWWPSAPELKALEAGGFAWLQVHSPPPVVLRDRAAAAYHASCLRNVVRVGGDLRVVLHAPDELRIGDREADETFSALITYASMVGARLLVYHAANWELADGSGGVRLQDRLSAEERSLRRFAQRAAQNDVVIALENLAPVYPSPPRVGHDPLAIQRLVQRLDSPAIAMTLDIGHAHITSRIAHSDLLETIAQVAPVVGLFHLHDNLGVRPRLSSPPGVVPTRLDLHLPPGRGDVPWTALGPLLSEHRAPLLLEILPPHRPQPLALATVTAELLARGVAEFTDLSNPAPPPTLD